MARSNTVEIAIVGDDSRYQKVIGRVTTTTESFGKKIGAVFGGLQLDRAVQGVVSFGKDSVAAFKESEQAAAQLDDAFARFPNLADTNAAALRKLNEQLAKKTRFDDDATSSGQAVLAQFGLTGKQIKQLTPLLQDYAAKTGKDLPTAADDLGKALLGKGRALAEIGIKFKDAGSVGANFENIVGGLRTQVGGFAEKEGATAAGQSAILANQFGELQETVGAKLLPVLQSLTEWGLKIVDFIGNLSPGVQTAVGVVAALAGVVFGIVKAVQAWTAVQAALNAVMAMNPIGLVVIAVAALVAGIIWAYKNVAWFRDGVNSALRFLGDVALWLGRTFSNVWDSIVGGFVWVVNNIKRLANWLAQNAINPAIDGINKVIRGMNIVNPFSDIPYVPKIPVFHDGGTFQAPRGQTEGLALLEDGEQVIPAGGGGGNGGGVVIQKIEVHALDARGAETAVVKALEGFFGRGGVVGNGRGGTLKPT